MIPVHIRGKKGRQKTRCTDIKKMKKRRLSPGSWDHLHASSNANSKASSGVSALELLPLELLESIFFEVLYSAIPAWYADSPDVEDWNSCLSLPRASPILGRKLASQTTTLRLLKAVYFPECYGIKPDLGWNNLQSLLLRLKWMNLAKWEEVKKPLLPGGDLYWIKKPLAPDHLHCLIPSKLLHGPWENGKLDFLRDLLYYGAKLDDGADSLDREITEQTLRDAIVSKDLDIIRLFVRNPRTPYDDGSKRSFALMLTDIAFLDGEEMECESETKHLPLLLDLEHVKLAVTEGGCESAVVATVLLLVSACDIRLCPWRAYSAWLDLERWWTAKRHVEDEEKSAWFSDILEKCRPLTGNHI